MTAWYWVRLFAGACFAMTAAAQQSHFAPPDPHWMAWQSSSSYAMSNDPACPATRPLLPRWTEAMQRLATAWAETPGATGPDLYAQMQAVLQSCKGRMRSDLLYWPWPASRVELKAVPGQPGKTVAVHHGETGSLTMKVNFLGGLCPVSQLDDSRNPAMGVACKVTRRYSGFPVYEGRLLLITVPGREPFAPLSVEDAVRAWLANSHRGEWGWEKAQTLLQGLDEAARRAPAYLHHGSMGHDEIVTRPGPVTEPLLRTNDAYFSRTLPPYVPQAMAVDLYLLDLGLSASDPRQPRLLARRMLEATDWQRMAALLQ